MKQYCFYQNYREVRLLVIHCSATRYDRDFPVEALRSAHKIVGSLTSAIITISPGMASCTAAAGEPGSGHTPRLERSQSGICYEGGLDERGLPADTRTYAQRCTLLDLLRQLRRDYPSAHILGHYQLSPYIRKACPCFDAEKEYAELY